MVAHLRYFLSPHRILLLCLCLATIHLAPLSEAGDFVRLPLLDKTEYPISKLPSTPFVRPYDSLVEDQARITQLPSPNDSLQSRTPVKIAESLAPSSLFLNQVDSVGCQILKPTAFYHYSYLQAISSLTRFGWWSKSFSQLINLDENSLLEINFRLVSNTLPVGFSQPVLAIWLGDELIYEYWQYGGDFNYGWRRLELDLSKFQPGVHQLLIGAQPAYRYSKNSEIELCAAKIIASKDQTLPSLPPKVLDFQTFKSAELPGEVTVSWQLEEASGRSDLPPGWFYDWRVVVGEGGEPTPLVNDHNWQDLASPTLIIRPGLSLVGATSTNAAGLQVASLFLPEECNHHFCQLVMRLYHSTGVYSDFFYSQ